MGDSPGCLFSVYAFAHNLSLVIDSMTLCSRPSGAKHAGSLCGGSLVRTTDGLNQLSETCTAWHVIPDAPYNTFCHPARVPPIKPGGSATVPKLRKPHSMRERRIVQLSYSLRPVDNHGKTPGTGCVSNLDKPFAFSGPTKLSGLSDLKVHLNCTVIISA